MRLKKLYGLGLAVALMAPIGVLTANPASAATVLTCAKPSGTVTFTPGISPTPRIQTTTFRLPVTACHGTAGYTSGTSAGKTVGKTKTNCANFGQAATQKTPVTITWNNGKKSVASLGTTIVPGAPGSLTASVSGKISSGAFLGKTIKTKVTVTLKGNCTAAKPITQAVLKGVAPLTIS
jgi:hypothetical protein